MKVRATVGVVLVAVLLSACAAGRAFRRGDEAARAGNWDAAVAYYTRAVQENPERAEYKIALERAMQNASRTHLTHARELEEQGQIEGALWAYRKAVEYDPTNRQAAAKVAEIERTIRAQVEAMRPRPRIDQLREEARRTAAEPLLHPASREPLTLQFTNASLRDVLNFIGNATGINVMYERDFRDVPVTVQLDGVTLEEGLTQILTASNHWYKVMNERTILIIPETPQKRAQYEEQVIRTFYVSHADVQELTQIITSIIRVPQMPVQPMIFPNRTANTITVRATAAVADVIERVIAANDKPRAEIVIDVQILEVNRSRARQFGLNLSQFAIGGIFSPEVAPPNQSTPPLEVTSPPPFNLNIISQGVSTADFFLAVPAAVVRFLESDSHTRLIAKPQLRGAEGTKLTLNLGDDIPVPSTAFTPIAGGGAAFNPLTSFNYRAVGVNIEMTPRVTYEGEILLELLVESSTLGQSIEVAGQALPTFGSRRVTTKLRLREGESNLLAGLLREDERRALRGFPGLLRVPGIRQLLSDNEQSISQTDIVMLLTPHIVRTHELTREDLAPIFIGTQQNIGLSGPPPLITPPVPPPDDPLAEPAPAAPPGAPPLGFPRPPVAPEPGVPTQPPVTPPGASPVPGVPVPVPAEPAVEPPAEPPAEPAEPPEAPPPPPAPGAAQVIVTPPGTEFAVGSGPYTVPISISGASRISVVSLTMTYDPSVVRVRSVQEGSFMRQGGIVAVFTHEVDAATGRIDMSIVRPGDQTGAAGSGLLAALLFEPVAPGSATLGTSGVATTPDGTPVPLQFTPVTVSVR